MGGAMTNTLYYGDNLDVLRNRLKDETIDLIYLDPPFKSDANYNVFFPSADDDGAQVEAFKDTWKWGEAAEHDADHGEAEEGGDGTGVALEVAGQAAVAADPGKGALDDPALGQDDKAMGVAALDDLQGPRAGLGDRLGHLWPLVSGVGEDAFDERKGPPCAAQQVARTIAVLQVARVEGDAGYQGPKMAKTVAKTGSW